VSLSHENTSRKKSTSRVTQDRCGKEKSRKGEGGGGGMNDLLREKAGHSPGLLSVFRDPHRNLRTNCNTG